MSLILEGIDLPFDGSPLKEVEITFHRIGGWDHKRYVFANEGLDLIKPIIKCKDCKHSKNCTYPAKWNWCPDGERKADEINDRLLADM